MNEVADLRVLAFATGDFLSYTLLEPALTTPYCSPYCAYYYPNGLGILPT